MQVSRTTPVIAVALMAIAACSGPSRKELQTANALATDSLFFARNELLEQVMEGTRFVNEINKELAKARSINVVGNRPLQPGAELVDANDERRQVITRITRLVERLDAVQGRVAGLRKELSDKDSVLKTRVAEYDQMVAEINLAADRQRAELQAVIDAQTVQIASLSGRVDTLTGVVNQLTTDQNTVYVVVGTRQELLEKGVVVPEGKKRFLVAGARPVAPARQLDPSAFTKLDRHSERTIVLPEGEYRILSRHDGSLATAEVTRKGKVTGALTIEEPERFWNGSRFLIIMKS